MLSILQSNLMSRSQVRLQQKQFELLEELKNLSEYDATERIHKYLEVAVQVDPIICPEISSSKFFGENNEESTFFQI